MTVYLEDMIEAVSSVFFSAQWQNEDKLSIAPADYKFVTDIAGKTNEGKQISTKQAEVAIRILWKYADILPGHNSGDSRRKDFFPFSKEEYLQAIKAPIYRQPPYQSVPVRREARYIGNRKIALRSKYSPQIQKRVRNSIDKYSLRNLARRSGSQRGQNSYDFPRFNKQHRLWILEVTEGNLEGVMRCIKKLNYEFDEPVEQFFLKCANSIENKTCIKTVGDQIEIEVQNDEFLSLWLEEEFKEKKDV